MCTFSQCSPAVLWICAQELLGERFQRERILGLRAVGLAYYARRQSVFGYRLGKRLVGRTEFIILKGEMLLLALVGVLYL